MTLKPCPFCGSEELSSEQDYIFCLKCQAVGPDQEFTGQAPFDGWNERAKEEL